MKDRLVGESDSPATQSMKPAGATVRARRKQAVESTTWPSSQTENLRKCSCESKLDDEKGQRPAKISGPPFA